MTGEVSTWNIEPSYFDAFGRLQTVDPVTIDALAAILKPSTDGKRPEVVVLRGSPHPHTVLGHMHGHWRLTDVANHTVASGYTDKDAFEISGDFAPGTYTLTVTNDDGSITTPVLVAPQLAYEPPALRDGHKVWILMVQLYGLRSMRNWGHGDFTDLAALVRMAADAGAAGVGLNPLHALGPGQASPYSPSSRSFLNSLYIDVEAIPEFPGIDTCGLTAAIERLRKLEYVDYQEVYVAKRQALLATFANFRSSAERRRQQAFAEFRATEGDALAQYSSFQILADIFGLPWQQWPKEYLTPDSATTIAKEKPHDAAFHAFVQWIAHEQLSACSRLAEKLGLPIGLCLDIAVGVDAGGADAWINSDALPAQLSIGAPPDIYNPAGQNWGLAALHPQALIQSDFSLLRQALRAAMRYASAIRIDHALGLNRLFLIPCGAKAAGGGYVRFPFEAMLAVIAQESVNAECLVVGEDLGTVPEGVSETLRAWGIWSYKVALFERESSGLFRRPDHFPEHAVVTFNTHDLATFRGWRTSHDLKVKRELGVDPGESEEERENARKAMCNTFAREGIALELSLPAVIHYLARTRCKILAVSLEDILGLEDQPNVPGTINEHPNWRRRLPANLDDISGSSALLSLSAVMREEGRDFHPNHSI